MDPYMERHFRLADRRGLLKGNALSRPQAFAVGTLMASEDQAKARDFVDQLKLSVVSHNPAFWLDRLFPQWASKGDESEDIDIDLDASKDDDLDFNSNEPTEWRFEPMDPAEAESMLAEMLANRNQGTVTATELEDEGWA